MAEGGIVSPSDYLAAERTFLAWIRTGLALMGFGFVVARFGLFLRETLLLRIHAFRREAILHLPLDLGLSFLFGLLFLAGDEKRQGGDQRENGKLLHGLVRH